MQLNLKNNPAKFHPDLFRNDESLGFLRTSLQQQQQQQQEQQEHKEEKEEEE